MPDAVASDRPIVRVTDNDIIAAMQILACISRPKNPARAGELLQQWFWARKRFRREGLPSDLEISIPDKGRIAAKLPALVKDIEAAMKAGEMFKSKWMIESDGVIVKAFGQSLRRQGAQMWNEKHKAQIAKGTKGRTSSRDDEAASAKQRIWHKRRPIAHMALAVRNYVNPILSEQTVELEELVFNPVWVEDVLVRAEVYAEVAIAHSILKPEEPWLFKR